MTTSATPSMVARLARVVSSLGLIGFLIATVVPFAARGGSAWERRMLENALLWPFGVQGLLIGSGHRFPLDRVADSIGWPRGNPAAVGHGREMLTKRNFSPGSAGPVLILDLGVPLLLIVLSLLYYDS